MQLGASASSASYLVLRDVYGDVFTYSGLGSIAPTYTAAEDAAAALERRRSRSPHSASPRHRRPRQRRDQQPLTLKVKRAASAHSPIAAAAGEGSITAVAPRRSPAGGQAAPVRAPRQPRRARRRGRQAAKRARARSRRAPAAAQGPVVSQRDRARQGRRRPRAHAGHLRFAIRPAGDSSTDRPRSDPRQLGPAAGRAAPRRARRPTNALLGATASDVLLLSRSELQRAVLSDPGITIYACGRHDVASGAIDHRVLAVLAFLSRSGLQPTVSALRCGQGPVRRRRRAIGRLSGRRRRHLGHQRHPVAGHQGARHDHRPDDPHAAHAARRIRAARRSAA